MIVPRQTLQRLLRTLALAFAAACAHQAPKGVDQALVGYRGRMPLEGELRIELEGFVGESPAHVLLDIASPLSTITTGCYLATDRPRTRRVVRMPKVEGGWWELPEVVVSDAQLGRMRLDNRPAGLVVSDARCVFTLGSEALAPFAIEIDPETREVGLSPSRPRQDYLREQGSAPGSAETRFLIELARDPKADWPLASARLLQKERQAPETFIVSTRERSSVSGPAALDAGLQSEGRVPDGIPSPERVRMLESSNATRFRMDEVQLAPGLGLRNVLLEAQPDWSNPGAVGVLGIDVWGHFRATLDAQAGVMVLRRPRLTAEGSRQLCGDGQGKMSEELCFRLRTIRLGDSLAALATVWRDLPEGARLHLDPLGPDGQSIASDCRFGLTLAPGDRGSSTSQEFPWQALDRSFPACVSTLRRAQAFALALFEEGSLEQCPGQCAFARHLPTGRLSCECAIGPEGQPGAGRAKALELYRRLMDKSGKSAPSEPPETAPE